MRAVTTSHILTPEDVARRWHVTTEVVTDMCRRGVVPAFKAGRYWRLHENAVTAYELRSQQVES